MQARASASQSKVIFDKKLVIIDADVTALYRGFEDMVPMIYTFPVVLGGLFGRHFPAEVSIWDVRNHKTTNLSSEFYFASMTTSLAVAKARGQGDYIRVDPAVFRGRIIDVNKSFARRSLTMTNTVMLGEAEQIALAIPFCAIQSFHLQDVTLANPFYIANADVSAFSQIYEDYLNLLYDKFNHKLAHGDEKQRLQEYVAKILDFYARFCGTSNPFAMTLNEFAAQHPEFGRQLLAQHNGDAVNALFKKHETLAEIAVRIADRVFSLHPYCHEIPVEKPACTTIYDDEYARPIYE